MHELWTISIAIMTYTRPLLYINVRWQTWNTKHFNLWSLCCYFCLKFLSSRVDIPIIIGTNGLSKFIDANLKVQWATPMCKKKLASFKS